MEDDNYLLVFTLIIYLIFFGTIGVMIYLTGSFVPLIGILPMLTALILGFIVKNNLDLKTNKNIKEENLSFFLMLNQIPFFKGSILLFDNGNEKCFLHFDNDYYYIIYKIGFNFQIKKRGYKRQFNYEIKDNFGQKHLFIKGLKNPLPITENLFPDDVEENLKQEIESKL